MYRLVLSAVLLACALHGPAQAATQWQFSYTGFFDYRTTQFNPDIVLRGSFAGTDASGNGVLEQDELTRFVWDHVQYGAGTCATWYLRCDLLQFSYEPGGALAFQTDYAYRDEVIYYDGYTTSDLVYASMDDYYLFTDQTVFHIAAVPEPPAVALALAGMLALLARARVRRVLPSR